MHDILESLDSPVGRVFLLETPLEMAGDIGDFREQKHKHMFTFCSFYDKLFVVIR